MLLDQAENNQFVDIPSINPISPQHSLGENLSDIRRYGTPRDLPNMGYVFNDYWLSQVAPFA